MDTTALDDRMEITIGGITFVPVARDAMTLEHRLYLTPRHAHPGAAVARLGRTCSALCASADWLFTRAPAFGAIRSSGPSLGGARHTGECPARCAAPRVLAEQDAQKVRPVVVDIQRIPPQTVPVSAESNRRAIHIARLRHVREHPHGDAKRCAIRELDDDLRGRRIVADARALHSTISPFHDTASRFRAAIPAAPRQSPARD